MKPEPEDTDRVALALDLERLSREVDLIRERNPDQIKGKRAEQLSFILATIYNMAHQLAPSRVPTLPRWPTSEPRDAENIAAIVRLHARRERQEAPPLRLLKGGA